MTEIVKLPIEEFTETTVDGKGVFDQLMQANKAHLEQEFQKNRIKGPEYATVYLGALESTMATALRFFIDGRKSELEIELMRAQIALANREIDLAEKKLEMMECEQALCRANILKVNADVEHIEAQTELVKQQEVLAVLQEATVAKEHCKLDAEFDLIMANVSKISSERELLGQKVYTERAQTSAMGVDPDSVIGKQKLLYAAQTKGFELDAYAVMAKELLSTWNVRVTTDSDGNGANAQNKLDDSNIGKVVQAWGQKHGVVL